MEIQDIEQETEERFLEYISDYNVYADYRFASAMFQKFFLENYAFIVNYRDLKENISDNMNDTKAWFEQQKDMIQEMKDEDLDEEVYFDSESDNFYHEITWACGFERGEKPTLKDILNVTREDNLIVL